MSRPPRDHARDKQLRYLKERGLAGWVPAGPVQERIRYLHDQRGITFQTIADRIGRDIEAVLQQYRGHRKNGAPVTRAQKATEMALFSARWRPEDGKWFPVLGIRRRLQAMAAAGFTTGFMGEQCGWEARLLHRCLSGQKGFVRVAAHNAQAIVEMYDKWAWTDPAEAGIRRESVSRAQNAAARNGYVPPRCWDPDTIDDPDALPEWTGACGTWVGARSHHREGIPMCPACAPHDLGVTVPGFSPVKLRALRERSGLSRVQLGELIGVHDSTIQYWEDGRSVPERHWKIDKLLSVLDATFEDVTEEAPSE